MAITPDLKADEFEIVNTCPIGKCIVVTAFAYSKALLEQPTSDIKEVKGRIQEMMIKAHKDGKHKVEAKS